jgi:hypothetical protein
MTGFGYDPSHSIVKARQEGLQAVLYKPFRADRLMDAVEQVLRAPGASSIPPNCPPAQPPSVPPSPSRSSVPSPAPAVSPPVEANSSPEAPLNES